MLPIVIVLVCIGWRVLKRRKAEARDESDFLTVKSRALDPDESMKINSDDDSIPYKKDLPEDSPEPTEPLQVPADSPETSGYPYGQPYNPPEPPPMGLPVTSQGRRWDGETEIN